VARLLHHPVVLDRGDLRGDRPRDGGGDLAQDVEELPAGLRDERRVGRHSVAEAHGERLLDLADVCRVDEELHF
jgi:hypothetical protein